MINKSKFNLKSVKVEDILTMPPPVVKNFLGSDLGQSYLSSLSPLEYNKLLASYGKNQLAPLTAPSGGAPSGGGNATAAPSGRQQQGRASAGPSATPAGAAGSSGRPSTQVKPSEDARFEWERQLEALAGKKPQQPSQQQQTNINQYQRIPGGIDRTSKLNELKDPETRKLFATMLQAEVGGYGSKDHQAFAEKVFNRAMIENKSLKQILSDKRYFEPYQNGAFRKAQQVVENNPNLLDQHLSTIDRVGYTGVDSIKGATHNASGSVAAAVRGERSHPRYGDFNSVKSSIIVVGRETFYSKTNEQERIRNLPRIAATGEQVSPGVSPEDAARTGSAGYGQGPMRAGQAGQAERRPGQAAGEEDLYGIAQSKRPKIDFGGFERSNSNCGRGTGAVVDAIFGTNHTKGGIGANAGAFAGRNPKPFIPQLYSGPSGLPEGYMNDPSQWRIGDVVAAQGGNGHIQVWNGKQWVSDFKQKGILPGYSGYTLHRVKPEAYSQVSSEYAKNMDQGGNTRNYLKQLGIDFGTAPVVGVERPEESNRKIVKPPEGYENLPEDIRKAIEALPESRRNAVYENLQAIKDRGDDFVSKFTQTYREAIDSKENPQNAAQQIAETASVSPNAAGSIAPGNLPTTIADVDLQGSNVKAESYARVVTNISGYSPGSQRPKAAGPGVVESTSEELNILKKGIDNRGPSLGYHAAVASFYYNKDTGEKIDETSYNRLSNNQKQNYIEKAEVHQLRNPAKRVSSMGGINPTTGKSWNADTYAIVRVGKMSAEKVRAYEDHLAEKLAKGEIPETAIRNIYGDGQLRPSERGHLEKETGGEGVADAKNINKQRIFERAKQIREQIEQQQRSTGQVSPQTQVPVSPGTDQGAAAATGNAGFVAAPMIAPSTPAPSTTAATPTPAPTPSAATPTPAPTPSAATPTPAPTPSAPAPAAPAPEAPTAETSSAPTNEPPKYEYGGEQQLDGENRAVVNTDTGEVEAKFNNTETAVFQGNRIKVTPASRDNSVGIEDRTQQLIAQEQVTADQQSNTLDKPVEQNMATNYMSDPYNKDWQEMMQEVKSASAQIFKNAAAQRAYDGHKFAPSGDAFGHFGFKTTTVRGLA